MRGLVQSAAAPARYSATSSPAVWDYKGAEDMNAREPRGMYFEDFEVDHTYLTPRRNVTHTDIVNLSCLSGDFNAPHVDQEFCKDQPYGEPIALGRRQTGLDRQSVVKGKHGEVSVVRVGRRRRE